MNRGPAPLIAVAASAGAGVIHLALGPHHLEELGPLGWGFFLAAALQLGWAALALGALMRSGWRSPWLAFGGIAINVALLGAWVVSRTAGLPAGDSPWVAEPIGRADIVAAALEVAILASLLVQRRGRATLDIGRVRLATALAFAIIATGTATGIAPDAGHAAAHEAAHDMTTEAGTVIAGNEDGNRADRGVGPDVDRDAGHAHGAGEQEHTH